MTGKTICITLFLMLFVFGGCNSTHQVEVKPVEIKPIHITIDVNVKVDKALDDFFSDIDDAEESIPTE
ncbi:MAG: YnbE family lipoprotein [Desulfobacteraceae bacterium]|nr:YnbE family lipoprotein [Desulfobacteraceae bacterium]